MYIKKNKLKKLTEKIDIKDFLSEMGFDFVVSGNDLMICCPYHDEKNPSMGVCFKGENKGLFRCLSSNCGQRGTIFHLYSFVNGISIKKTLEKFDLDFDPETISELKKIFYKKIISKKKEGIKYLKETVLDKFSEPEGDYLDYLLKKRKFKKSIIKKFGIKAAVSGKYEGRIIYPLRDVNGKLVSLTARSIYTNEKREKIRKTKNSDVKKILPGLYEIKKWVEKNRMLVFVEGEADMIYLQQFGIPAVCLGNTDFDSFQINIIIKYADKGFLMLDGDVDLNSFFIKKKIEKIRKYISLKIIKLPKNKDPNDLTKKEVLEIKEKIF